MDDEARGLAVSSCITTVARTDRLPIVADMCDLLRSTSGQAILRHTSAEIVMDVRVNAAGRPSPQARRLTGSNSGMRVGGTHSEITFPLEPIS